MIIREMELKNFSKGTYLTYLSAVKKLCRHYEKQPKDISSREIEDYIISLQDEGVLSLSTIHSNIHALKFLVNKTLKRKDDPFIIDSRRAPKVLPEVLSVNEVKKVINCKAFITMRAII